MIDFLCRRIAPLAVGLCVLAARMPVRAAAPLLSPDEVRALESRMVHDPARLRARLGAFSGWITGHEHVDLARVGFAPYDALACVLDRAVERGLTSSQMFSDPLFARGGGLSLFVDRDVLEAVERDYDLHSVFLIDPRPTDGKGPLGMSFFLIGQGVLVLSYPRAGAFDHPDAAFRVSVPMFGSSREYEVAPLIRMDIVEGPAPGFDHVGTLAAPGAPLEDFVGPWNASIRSIAVRGSHIDVHAHLVFGRTQTIDVPRIQRRPGRAADAACFLHRDAAAPP